MRNSLQDKRDPLRFATATLALLLLRKLADAHYRQLYYYDESRFPLVSNVPRAWQAPGPTHTLPTTRGPGVNVAGFLRHDGTELHAYSTPHRLTSADVIPFFDDFCQQLSQPTVVVLDYSTPLKSRNKNGKNRTLGHHTT